MFERRKKKQKLNRKKSGKLLCWLIDFFAGATLVDGITMEKKNFDFCFVLLLLRSLVRFFLRHQQAGSFNKLGIDWSLAVCLPSRVLVDGIFDNV